MIEYLTQLKQVIIMCNCCVLRNVEGDSHTHRVANWLVPPSHQPTS